MSAGSEQGGGVARRWVLELPDWAELDTLWRSSLPFGLWPVCEKPLLAYWLDEAVRVGVESVGVLARDRPHLVRAWLEEGNLWSRAFEVWTTMPAEGWSGEGVEVKKVVGLPGMEISELPRTGQELMLHWYRLQGEALARRRKSPIHLDREVQPGVWVGPGAVIAADTRLQGPSWIGAYARVGNGVKLGPGAFVGPGAYVDDDVEIEESVVCADTYVGKHTSLRGMVAQGGVLLDLRRGTAVEIVDRFVLSSLREDEAVAAIWERVVAWVLRPVLELVADWVNGGCGIEQKEYRIGRSTKVVLATRLTGPLFLRRAGWLREVAAGRMRFVGVLPRTEEDWARLPAEARAVLEKAAVGVFSLADLYGVHTAAEPDEWMHAVYQAASPDGAGKQLAERAAWRIALQGVKGGADE